MAKITFVTLDNERITVEGNSGSVMELAIENNIKGIEAECGGVCSCGTCHVHVEPEYFEKTGGPNDIEGDYLELNDNANEYSRLSCQMEITEDLDGLVVKVAEPE